MLKQSQYTTEQLSIITYTESDLLVDAIPGSGKTFTMVGKAVWESQQGNNVLVITHTKVAAGVFKSRLDKLDHKDIEVRTIHSLAYKVLSNEDQVLGKIKDFDKLLYGAQLCDIKDYDVIIIDEAQDINSIQYDLIKNIPGRKIFVGDRNQTIFMFAGAKKDFFSYLMENGYKYMTLSFTFRTSGEIVEFLNRFKAKAFLPGPKIKAIKTFKTELILTKAAIRQPEGYVRLCRYNNEKGISRIFNIHEIKGKEFNNVYINIPNEKYFAKDLDRLMLIYVAITRARQKLMIAGYTSIPEIFSAGYEDRPQIGFLRRHFVCQLIVARYFSSTNRVDWQIYLPCLREEWFGCYIL